MIPKASRMDTLNILKQWPYMEIPEDTFVFYAASLIWYIHILEFQTHVNPTKKNNSSGKSQLAVSPEVGLGPGDFWQVWRLVPLPFIKDTPCFFFGKFLQLRPFFLGEKSFHHLLKLRPEVPRTAPSTHCQSLNLFSKNLAKVSLTAEGTGGKLSKLPPTP